MMEKTFLDIFAQYGLAGLIILGMAWYILKLNQFHNEREKYLYEIIKEKSDKADKYIIESIDIIEKNTAAFIELRTIIQQSCARQT